MKLDKEETKRVGIKVMRKEEAVVEKTEAPKAKKEKKEKKEETFLRDELNGDED